MSASSSVLWSDQSRSRKAPVNMAELFESGGLSAARTHSYLRQKQDITGTIWKGEEKIRPNEFSRRWNWMYLPDSVQKYIPKFIWSQHEALAVWMKQAECSRVTVFYYTVPAYC